MVLATTLPDASETLLLTSGMLGPATTNLPDATGSGRAGCRVPRTSDSVSDPDPAPDFATTPTLRGQYVALRALDMAVDADTWPGSTT